MLILGMRILADEMGKSTPQRCKSPHMNNEEPIRNSHFPDGHPPNGNGEDTPDQVSQYILFSTYLKNS